MPIPKPTLPTLPEPTKIFDPFNSSSTGHQIADDKLSGSTSWRHSRTYKLGNQFRDSSGRGGAQHIANLVGAGSDNFGKDGRKEDENRLKGVSGLHENGWQDIRDILKGTKKRHLDDATNQNARKRSKTSTSPAIEVIRGRSSTLAPTKTTVSSKAPLSMVVQESSPNDQPTTPPKSLPQIFDRLTIYLNGSTAPLISDHRLKTLFVSHGGNVCLGLARRSVTHVILGQTGALASGKIQKEVRRVTGEKVFYVTAQWVVDSIAAGKRKAEGQYMPKDLGIRGTHQKSVGEMFSKPKTS